MADDLIDELDEDELIKCIHRFERSPAGTLLCRKCGIPIPEPVPEPDNEPEECHSGKSALDSIL